jgi:hypothetical protein
MDKKEEYQKALDVSHKIYELFEESALTVPEAMTVLVMMLLSIAEEQGITTSDLIVGIRRQNELHEALQNPHSTVQ